jgi:hypothetical protein
MDCFVSKRFIKLLPWSNSVAYDEHVYIRYLPWVFELPCIATWPLLHHTFNISAEANCSRSLDAPLWVALAIVQSYNPRRKVPRSEISMPDLEICLSKAVFAAAQHSGTTPCSLFDIKLFGNTYPNPTCIFTIHASSHYVYYLCWSLHTTHWVHSKCSKPSVEFFYTYM